MKNLIYILIFIPSLLFSQETKNMEFVGLREIELIPTNLDAGGSTSFIFEVDSGNILKILNILESSLAGYSSNTIKLDDYLLYRSSSDYVNFSNLPLFVTQGAHELTYSCWTPANCKAKLSCTEFKLTTP